LIWRRAIIEYVLAVDPAPYPSGYSNSSIISRTSPAVAGNIMVRSIAAARAAAAAFHYALLLLLLQCAAVGALQLALPRLTNSGRQRRGGTCYCTVAFCCILLLSAALGLLVPMVQQQRRWNHHDKHNVCRIRA
jgi:hypothetical protein